MKTAAHLLCDSSAFIITCSNSINWGFKGVGGS